MTVSKPRPESGDQTSDDGSHLQLRLLETTDVHANLLPFDYYADNCETSFGLARTASLIKAARAEVANCLLLDNGDFLQGTPLSDLTAQQDSGWRGPHPAVTAMNYLKYDAAGLGNHEFNFGLEWLRDALSQAEFPVTCANAVIDQTPNVTDDTTLLPPYVILDRRLIDNRGRYHDLRIGIIALLPPQITTWDHFHLHGKLTARDIVETARAWVPQIRAQGADIVVALAHSGIDGQDFYPMKENVALALGELSGIDAILAGHTHEVFPKSDVDDLTGADNEAGTLNGTPAVMAGFRGSHLGVLDLYLQKTASGWVIAAHRSQARPVIAAGDADPTAPDETLKKLLWPAHQHTLDLIRQPLGKSDVPLHSYLALVRNDPGTQLVTRAQAAALRRMVQGTPDADLPILSASAPFKTGGRGGPKYYTDVPSGDFRLRNAADLYAFPNTLCALRMTGAQLRDWLERAAACFNRIVPGRADQPLINPLMPGHNFDVIDGLSYVIDLSQPARFDDKGRLVDPTAYRIAELCHDGKPIAENRMFLLAANSFRAHGGGPYPQLPDSSFAISSRVAVRDIVAQYVQDRDTPAAAVDPIWRFAAHADTSVIFETGPGIRRHEAEIKALGAVDLGDTSTGFVQLRLPLDPPATVSLANPADAAYVSTREVGAGERLANPVRSGRKQP